MLLTPAQTKSKSFESRRNSFFLFLFYRGGCTSCLRACLGTRLLPQTYLYPNLSESADRVGGQLRGDKECPFSGVTKSGRVWRKVPESDARSVMHWVTSGPNHTFTVPPHQVETEVQSPKVPESDARSVMHWVTSGPNHTFTVPPHQVETEVQSPKVPESDARSVRYLMPHCLASLQLSHSLCARCSQY